MTSKVAAHRADLERGTDRLILAGGKKIHRAAGPGCSCCKDLDEALARHGGDTPEQLSTIAALLGEITEPVELSLDGEARRIAKIKDPLKRAQAIVQLLDDGKLKRGLVGGFRGAVAQYTGNADRDEEPDAGGGALTFDAVLPWPDPVEGDELLEAMTAAIHRHAFCTAEDAVLGALWVIHSARRHHGNIGTLPRLIVTAGREDAGKTHYALALKYMSDTAEHTISPTPANIYRSIQAHGCMFFLDEVDDWYRTDKGMREIINSGFNKSGASVLRCEDTGQDGRTKLESRRFSTFTPIALIGIGIDKILARPVVSRALIVHLRPARAGEEVVDLYDNPPAVAALGVIARKVKRWVADNELALTVAEPARPDGVINRLWITWRPLLAIAELAGGDWPGHARDALATARSRGADPGLGVQLLADVYDVVHAAPAGQAGPRMATGNIIAELLKLEERPWGFYGKARVPIRDVDVARLLAPYEVKPVQLKTDGKNRRGYLLHDLETAIDRYAPSLFFDSSVRTRYPRYPATSDDKPNGASDLEGSGQVAGRAEPATTAATGVAGSGLGVSTRYPVPGNENNELEEGSGVAGPGGVPRKNKRTAGNSHAVGAEVEDVIAGAAAGTRCAFCHCLLDGAASEEIGGKRYHADACAAEARKNAAEPPAPSALEPAPEPKKRRSRIKGADTTPMAEKLPCKEPPA
jgi:hypothetical protein